MSKMPSNIVLHLFVLLSPVITKTMGIQLFGFEVETKGNTDYDVTSLNRDLLTEVVTKLGTKPLDNLLSLFISKHFKPAPNPEENLQTNLDQFKSRLCTLIEDFASKSAKSLAEFRTDLESNMADSQGRFDKLLDDLQKTSSAAEKEYSEVMEKHKRDNRKLTESYVTNTIEIINLFKHVPLNNSHHNNFYDALSKFQKEEKQERQNRNKNALSWLDSFLRRTTVKVVEGKVHEKTVISTTQPTTISSTLLNKSPTKSKSNKSKQTTPGIFLIGMFCSFLVFGAGFVTRKRLIYNKLQTIPNSTEVKRKEIYEMVPKTAI